MLNEFLKPKGEIVIETRTKDGKVKERKVLENTIVTTGKNRVADLIGGVSTGVASFSHMAIGESETGDSVVVGDTALKSEVTREAPSISLDGNQVIFEHTFTFGTGDSYSIKEVGLFDSATETGSTMLNRAIFSAKNVDIDTDLYIKITITVS